MTTKTPIKIYGEQLEISADFGQASSQISLNGKQTQWQVADFKHDCRAALTAVITQAFDGDVDEEEVEAAIIAAFEAEEA